ncbi:MAG: hypothetical protein RL085_972, partial [Actinomycetota bacterium]
MDNKNLRISNAFQFGLLGGLGVLTSIALGNAFLTLASVVTYVALALFIALGLEPIVSFIERKLKFKRGFAIATVVGALTAVLATLIWSILPLVIEQTGHFIESAPNLLSSVKDLELVASLDQQFGGSVSNAIDEASVYLTDSSNWPSMVGGVVQVGLSVFNGFFGALIVVTLSLYFMSSLSRLKQWIYSLVPATKRDTFSNLAEQIAGSVGRYVMGQVTIALINATLGFTMMSILGIEFSL